MVFMMTVDGTQGAARYEDTGCWAHPRCLECPRALCVYDEPPSSLPKVTMQRAQQRAAELSRLLDAGHTLAAAADVVGVSRRQAYRLLRRYVGESVSVPANPDPPAPRPQPPAGYLTVSDAARQAGIGRNRVLTLAGRGRVGYYHDDRVGGCVRAADLGLTTVHREAGQEARKEAIQ